jgi:Holliday junction resolvase RusA-like endonuclease
MAAGKKIEFEPVKFQAWIYTGNHKADGDNIIKAISDGCNKHAFSDDKQICEWHVWRIWSKNPRVVIDIEETTEQTEEC